MKTWFAFLNKERLECIRNGKAPFLFLIFILFGVLNPAITKLFPWLMEQMRDTLAQTGFSIQAISVDAFMSWTQFFKNIPMALIAFVFLFSNIFTKEYQSNTLILMLTKGIKRYQVLWAKALLLLLLWTIGYWLCFSITYGYNAYYWDNHIVHHLLFVATLWWLFGVWIISMIVFFSTISKNSSTILLGITGVIILAYLVGMFPNIRSYTPMMLMKTTSLLQQATMRATYYSSIYTTLFCIVLCMGVSIPLFNRKQL